VNKKVAVNMNVGYKYIGTVFKVDYYYDSDRSIESNHAVTLRWGVVL